MKTSLFVLAFVLALPAAAQTAAPADSAALTPAQIADYQKRFQDGYALEKAGKLPEARAIYDGILAEQPDAKRSLLEAGRVSLDLNEPAKADAYLDKLHKLVPDFPDAIELLIQANQALRRDVKVDRLVREFRTLHDSGQVPGFSDSLYFERERVQLDPNSQIIISQFFDFTKAPYYVLKAELYNAQHQRQRLLLLKYDPDETASIRAKNPNLTKDSVFILAEPFYIGDQMTRIDVYKTLLSTPDYQKARTLLLSIFVQTPKPIYSAKVNASASDPDSSQ